MRGSFPFKEAEPIPINRLTLQKKGSSESIKESFAQLGTHPAARAEVTLCFKNTLRLIMRSLYTFCSVDQHLQLQIHFQVPGIHIFDKNQPPRFLH